MPIKTLHITNCYHASSGGIRTFYRALLAAANQHRRHLRLVVPGPEDSVEEIGEFGRIYSTLYKLQNRLRIMEPCTQ